jgi:hypothetical protein
VGEREAVAYFRDGIVRALENIGTVKSCKAIEQITSELPELDWLKSVLVEAKKNTIRKMWQPPTPEQLLDMANRHARLVRNESELQDAVIISLKRLEAKLQGETPAAQFLWDGQKKKRPKQEDAFSDFVKLHLEEDLKRLGIAALREVEIRRGTGNKPGENPDIYVTVVVPNALSNRNERIVLIVESKGCWHQDLLSAMETQLRDRYLEDNQCTHGVYLVGWFACPQCEYDNCKTKICNKYSIDDLRKQLDEKAVTLSRNGLKIKSLVVNASLR